MNQNDFCNIISTVKEDLEKKKGQRNLPSNLDSILRELFRKHLLEKANVKNRQEAKNLETNKNIGIIGNISTGKTFLLNTIFNLQLPGTRTEEIQLIKYHDIYIIDTPGFNRITKNAEMNDNERFAIKNKDKKIESFVLKNSSVIIYVINTLNLFVIKKVQNILKKIENQKDKKLFLLYNNTFITNKYEYEQFMKREKIFEKIKVETIIMCPYSKQKSIKRIKEIANNKLTSEEIKEINTAKIDENLIEKKYDETTYWKYIRLNTPGYSYYLNSDNNLVIEIEATSLSNCKITNKLIGKNTHFTIEAKKKPCIYLENGKSIINNDDYSFTIKVPLKVAILKNNKFSKQIYKNGLLTFIYEAKRPMTENDDDDDDE